jgi:hypothetical protein
MFKVFMFILGAVLFVLLVVAGYLYYKLSDSTVYVAPKPEQGISPSTKTTTVTETNEVTSEASPTAVPAAGFTIDVSTLPESQQAILETLGFADTVTFTPDMVQCAEKKLGVTRVAEIVGGSEPSVIESTKLVPCL